MGCARRSSIVSSPRSATLPFPFPPGCRVVSTHPTASGEVLVTLQMTLPWGVAEVWATTLEMAGRMTGSDRLGAMLAAIAAEVLSTWQPALEDNQPAPMLEGD